MQKLSGLARSAAFSVRRSTLRQALNNRTTLTQAVTASIVPTTKRHFASFYDDRFLEDAMKIPPRVTFQDLLTYDPRSESMTRDDLVKSARRVQQSLPMRVARRINDMNNLPYGVMIHPLMQQVYNYYRSTYLKLVQFPPITTYEHEEAFSELLPDILNEGQEMLPILARASREIKQHMDRDKLKAFLDYHLTSRISRRLLAEQHVAIRNQFFSKEKNDDFVGILATKCDAQQIARKTYQLAQRICRDHYGCAPSLEFVHPKPPTTFPYIPVRFLTGRILLASAAIFLEYILIELFKNAVRATVEHTDPSRRQDSLPKVQVSIYNQQDEVTIRIADRAGGIPAEKLSSVMDYAYTTVGNDTVPEKDDEVDGLQAFVGNKPMAGEGFGLPMARVYCRYFMGDLTMQSIFGHGTEVFVRLKHLDPSKSLSTLQES